MKASTKTRSNGSRRGSPSRYEATLSLPLVTTGKTVATSSRTRLPKSHLANFFLRLARLLLDCNLCIFNHLQFPARVTLPLCHGRVPSPGIFLSGNNAFLRGIIGVERIKRKRLGLALPLVSDMAMSCSYPVTRIVRRRDRTAQKLFTASLDPLKTRAPNGPCKLRLQQPPRFQHGSRFL
jgi:hypothetical protein